MAWETWFGNSTAANPAAGWRQENGKIPTPGEHFRPVPSLSGGTHIDWSKECVVPGFELTLVFFWLFGTNFSGLELSSKHPGKPHPMALLRYSTFLRVFKARWSDVLKFREKNLCLANNKPYMCLFGNLSYSGCVLLTLSLVFCFHWIILNPHPRFSRCEFCFHQSQQISDRSASLEEKLHAVKVYRDHLYSQYCDRSIQWSLEEASRDPSSGVLSILLDGMDQAKFRLPKHPGHRAVSSMTLG